MKPVYIFGVVAILLLGVVLGMVGMYYYAHKPVDVPQDAHYSRLNYKVIDEKKISRLQIQSALDGCTRACSNTHSDQCESSCACAMNQLAARMTNEEIIYYFLHSNSTEQLPPIINTKLLESLSACR